MIRAINERQRSAIRSRNERSDIRRQQTLLRAAGVVVALGAAIGASVALTSAVRGAPVDPNRPAFEVGIAHPASTSFGTVAVEYAQFLGGPSLTALNGTSHNVGALVAPNRMEVEATVTITNASRSTVDYSPSQFVLLVGDRTKPIIAKRASVGDGTLQPDAGIDVRVTFETAISKKNMTLRYVERDGSAPILLRLGHRNVTTQRAHGEKPGQIVGIGQKYHAARGAAAALKTHTSHNHPTAKP